MTRRHTRWTAGTPCWADLTSGDLQAARTFYSALFGWTYHSEEDNGHVIAQSADADAAGLRKATNGAPSAWTLYIASDDADATAAAVTAHGGSVVFPPADVGGLGRGFAATDPSGAVFGVWDARSHIGAGSVHEPATLSWTELRTPEPDAMRSFYAGVFGHKAVGGPGDMDQSSFRLPGEEIALGSIRKSVQSSGAWSVFFGTSDVKATVSMAERNGGTLVVAPAETPRGHVAMLTDPTGAQFWIIEPI
ncbi:VOC family protein [Streptomyces sp. NPDC057199]|uniref:VOC family protein n=1 Tax=Streptomyces sp. NPDC057199 TaxID=3346047 RepID=UPI003624BDE2